jgi:predicted nucleic acid-binding protein
LEATHLVLDDENARKIGGKMKQLRLIGTVGILARLERQGFAKDTRDLVEKLRRDLGFRIADRLVEDAIEKATFLI